jgi:hypothetical protein
MIPKSGSARRRFADLLRTVSGGSLIPRINMTYLCHHLPTTLSTGE